MNRQDLLDLDSVHANPAVSILLPLDQLLVHRHENEIRLRHLTAEAEALLVDRFGEVGAKPIISRLERIKVDLSTGEPSPGLAIYVTDDSDRVVPLPFPVREQVSLDTTFATRQLFAGLARQPAYRVLVLTRDRTRLLEDRGNGLRELTTSGFPLVLQPPHEQDTPHADIPIHEEAEREEHRIVYRAVDQALDRVVRRDPLPLVLIAAEREASIFTEVSHHRDSIIGSVHGSHAHTPTNQLAELTRPVLDNYLAAHAEAAVDRIRETGRSRQLVAGPAKCWQVACVEGAHLLVVEESFQFPEFLTDGFLAPDEERPPGGTVGGATVVDDLVDEIIQHVASRGGEVVFVPTGSLSDFGGIALLRKS